jgi:hypothetical protein
MIFVCFGQSFMLVPCDPTSGLINTAELCIQVQQPNDFVANYYTYRPSADADCHLSPITAPGAAVKSGNMSVAPAQTGQAQEVCI